MSAAFKVGDRVRIIRVHDNSARSRESIGKIGVIASAYTVQPPAIYFVNVDDVIYVAAEVESVIETLASAQAAVAATTGVKVGDRVRIVQARDNDGKGRASVGKAGTLKRITPPSPLVGDHVESYNILPTYTVEADGAEYSATEVEPAPSEPELVLDPRRVAAAREAVSILWDGAEEVDVELLAEWLLNERPVATAKPVREPIDDQTFTGWYERLGAQPARSFFITNASDPTSKPDADEAAKELKKAKVLTDSVLTLGDLEVDYDACDDDDVVAVGTDRCEYLKEDQVDELIAYLQAAKLRHVARRETRES